MPLSPPGARARSLAPLRRVGLALAFCLSLPASATQLVEHNLSQLIGRADLIVSGRVTAVSEGVDRGMPYTEVTIAVASSAKKKLQTRSSFKFRQFGTQQPRKMADGRYFLGAAPEGFPQWRKDEQVLAFLGKPASKTGLRTTVGLSQGKFNTLGGRAANAQFNRHLFKGVSLPANLLSKAEAEMIKRPVGAVDAAALMGLVNRAVVGQWIEKGVMK